MRGIARLVLPLLLVGCQGVGKLDPTTLGRGTWQRPTDVVAMLDLEEGDRVADLGAGDGYFVPYLAEAVGTDGRVYAVDVDSDAVGRLADAFPAESSNVEAVHAEANDPALPDGSIDLVLLVNTYHHIEDRPDYFRELKRDLRSGGRVVVIEPNDDLGGVLRLALDEGHTSSAPSVEAEMREAGYRVDARHEILPVQIFLVFSSEDDAG